MLPLDGEGRIEATFGKEKEHADAVKNKEGETVVEKGGKKWRVGLTDSHGNIQKVAYKKTFNPTENHQAPQKLNQLEKRFFKWVKVKDTNTGKEVFVLVNKKSLESRLQLPTKGHAFLNAMPRSGRLKAEPVQLNMSTGSDKTIFEQTEYPYGAIVKGSTFKNKKELNEWDFVCDHATARQFSNGSVCGTVCDGLSHQLEAAHAAKAISETAIQKAERVGIDLLEFDAQPDEVAEKLIRIVKSCNEIERTEEMRDGMTGLLFYHVIRDPASSKKRLIGANVGDQTMLVFKAKEKKFELISRPESKVIGGLGALQLVPAGLPKLDIKGTAGVEDAPYCQDSDIRTFDIELDADDLIIPCTDGVIDGIWPKGEKELLESQLQSVQETTTESLKAMKTAQEQANKNENTEDAIGHQKQAHNEAMKKQEELVLLRLDTLNDQEISAKTPLELAEAIYSHVEQSVSNSGIRDAGKARNTYQLQRQEFVGREGPLRKALDHARQEGAIDEKEEQELHTLIYAKQGSPTEIRDALKQLSDEAQNAIGLNGHLSELETLEQLFQKMQEAEFPRQFITGDDTTLQVIR